MIDLQQVQLKLSDGTDESLAELKAMSDDDLLRCASSVDMFSSVEATRRLRVALIQEETVIRRLTLVLVWFTAALFVLAGIEAWKHLA